MKFPHLELTHSYITTKRPNQEELFCSNGLEGITGGVAWFHGEFAVCLLSVTLAGEFSKAKVTFWA